MYLILSFLLFSTLTNLAPKTHSRVGTKAYPPANSDGGNGSNGGNGSGHAPPANFHTRLSGLMAQSSSSSEPRNEPQNFTGTSSLNNDPVGAPVLAFSELALEGDDEMEDEPLFVGNPRNSGGLSSTGHEVHRCILVFSCMLVCCINLRVCIC